MSRRSLRQRAEARVSSDPPDVTSDHERLHHELEVHQVELQMQDEELRRTREELIASEERYWGFYEFAPVGYFTLNPRLRIQTANLAGADLLGVERAHLVGTPLRYHVSPACHPGLDAFIDRILEQGGRQTVELELARPSSSSTLPERWVQAEGRRTPEDSSGSILITMMDVTARKRAEAALAESERQYRQLVEDAPQAILVQRMGVTVYANPATARLFGLASPLEAVGRTLADLVHPESRGAATAMLSSRGNGATTARDAVLRLPEGDEITVRYWGQPVRIQNDGAVQLVIQDVTAERRAQRQLQEHIERLRISNEELQRFAYVASHDLQEPLRSIVSFSELLERRYRGRLDQDADDYIAFIVEGGVRMQALILDLLQFSRVQTAGAPPEPTSAGSAVAAALRALQAPLEEAGATVEVGAMPTVWADPTQLEQVFSNLIGNAVKYRRPEVPPRISVSARRLGPVVEFAVQDNGIGIEEEYFGRIFEMFRRLHTHEKYGGTGIGLAVVKRIVERLGGKVWVESTPGEGSTFYFTLRAA